jgi:hypothetical protein
LKPKGNTVTLKNWPFKNKCEDIADLLYCQYVAEENRDGEESKGCGDLMLEWIKDRFWGQIVEDHIPTFRAVYNILLKNGNTSQKNCYVYGDLDVGIWIEKTKNPKDKKVIASTRYCSMADDNTHLYIMTGLKFVDMDPPDFNFLKFYCRTVWPRQKKEKFHFGDDRDIKIPSLRTYQERDFKFSYQDCRDKGHVFTYNAFMGPSLDKAHWHETRIPHALQALRWHLEALKDYERNKCS